MLPTRLLHRPKGVPGWAQHMAKQPTKAGRLPPTAWSNAPPNGDASSHVPNPDEPAPGASQAPSGSEVKSQSPGASQASGFPAAPASNTPPAGTSIPPSQGSGSGSPSQGSPSWPPAQGSEARAWSEIRSGAAQASQGMKQAINDAVPDGARMAPKQEGPWGPKRDRSKGLMDSFRALSPNQRILIGMTFLAMGLSVYAYDQLVLREEELEMDDDLRDRLRKAKSQARGSTSEGPNLDDVAAIRAAQGVSGTGAGVYGGSQDLGSAARGRAGEALGAPGAVVPGVNITGSDADARTRRAAEAGVAAGVVPETAPAREQGARAAAAVAGAMSEASDAASDALAQAKDVAENTWGETKGVAADTWAETKDKAADAAARTKDAAWAARDAAWEAAERAADGRVEGAEIEHMRVPERTKWFGIRLRDPNDK